MTEISVVSLVLKKNLAKMAVPAPLGKTAPNTWKSCVPGAQDSASIVAFLVHPGPWLMIAPARDSGPSVLSVHLIDERIYTRETSLLNGGPQPLLNTESAFPVPRL